MSNSLRPHESQHARPPCPWPTPRVYSNSCPLNWWCNPTISSSVIPFSSCPQSLPASGSFPMSQLFAGGGQSIGVSASASVLPMNTQDWSPLGWTGWISLQSKGLSRLYYLYPKMKKKKKTAEGSFWDGTDGLHLLVLTALHWGSCFWPGEPLRIEEMSLYWSWVDLHCCAICCRAKWLGFIHLDWATNTVFIHSLICFSIMLYPRRLDIIPCTTQ